MAVADKRCHQVAGTRHTRSAGKPGATAPGGNRAEREPLTQGGSRKKRGEGRSPDPTALPQRGGEPPPTTRGRGGRAEWETGRSALVGAKPRDQPPTGAKRARSTRRGARSTAPSSAPKHMKRPHQKASIGARARAAATRKRGSPKHKAVAGGAGRSLRPQGRG